MINTLCANCNKFTSPERGAQAEFQTKVIGVVAGAAAIGLSSCAAYVFCNFSIINIDVAVLLAGCAAACANVSYGAFANLLDRSVSSCSCPNRMTSISH